MMQGVFWFALSLIAYAYFGYPLLILVWPGRRSWLRRRYEPTISFVISVRNGGALLDEKIRHLLSLRYPAELREIVVVSDGSTDDTADRLRRWSDTPCVHTIVLENHGGKAHALNIAMQQASGEIAVFNDVRQKLEPEALPLLLENFADPNVGCASGELHFQTEGREGLKTTLYWKFERWLRGQESLLGSCMGATGAFYAIRRDLFRPLPKGLILDDVYTPLQIALTGRRVIHDSRAHVLDVEAASEKHEFRRKVRTLGGNYQLVGFLPGLLRPGRIGLQFLSHKLMRLFVPLFLLLLMAGSIGAEGAIYRLAFWGQIAFYAVGLAGLVAPRITPGPLGIPSAFLTLNAAAAMAFLQRLAGAKIEWRNE